MENKKDFPAIVDIFESGYGESLARSLLDAIDRYACSFDGAGAVFDEHDSENVCNLVMLLKAVLRDCCGIAVK